MGIEFNFENVEERSFSPLPEGTYTLQLVKADYTKPDDPEKKSFINTEYDVVEGEHANKKVWDRIYTNEKSMWRVKQWLEALTNAPVPPTMNVDLKELIGLTVRATITHRTYTGNDGTEKIAVNVKQYNAAEKSESSGFKML